MAEINKIQESLKESEKRITDMEHKHKESNSNITNLIDKIQSKVNEMDVSMKNSDLRHASNENRLNTLDSRTSNLEINIDFIENQVKKLMERAIEAPSSKKSKKKHLLL